MPLVEGIHIKGRGGIQYLHTRETIINRVITTVTISSRETCHKEIDGALHLQCRMIIGATIGTMHLLLVEHLGRVLMDFKGRVLVVHMAKE